MSDETNFAAIEERLQAEARRLLATEGTPSASQLAGVRRRRQRRRRAGQAAGAAAALLLVTVAVRFGGSRAERAQVPLAPQQATVATLERGTAARGHDAADGSVPPRGAADQPDEGVFVIPFVIGDPAAGEEVITGIYVPEQAEPIDLRNLSPAERDAVRALLGIEGEDTDVIQPI